MGFLTTTLWFHDFFVFFFVSLPCIVVAIQSTRYGYEHAFHVFNVGCSAIRTGGRRKKGFF